MIPYKFHAGDNYWDCALLKDIFADPRFTQELGNGCVYVVPGEYQTVSEINRAIKDFEWVVLIVTSDEQSAFKVEKIEHPNIKIYIQYPKQGRHDDYGKWPLGYTSETRQHLQLLERDNDYFFAGQVTHARRKQCLKALERISNLNGKVLASEGFSQGYETKEYMEHMCGSRVVPCPSGPVCADSFRTYEALEAGAIPIADNISLAGDHDYWNYLFDAVPFPTLNDYESLPGYIEDQLIDFQAKANKVQAWWIKKKQDLKHQLIQDVADLSGKHHKEAITVVIPLSPIKSHPSTAIIEETIKSIRSHLNAEVILMFDGVRQEQEHLRTSYEQFIRKALFKANTEWGNIVPIIFDEHKHQSGMMKSIIEDIKTPLLMFVEADTPITPDWSIDFRGITDAIISGEVSSIRLNHEALILDDYKHMMLDEQPIDVQGVPLIRTAQYSARPHIASVAFYKKLLSLFSDGSKAFLEDYLHGVIYEAYKIDGVLGWQNYRLSIYHPEGNIKRSFHLDGREGEPKWDNLQKF